MPKRTQPHTPLIRRPVVIHLAHVYKTFIGTFESKSGSTGKVNSQKTTTQISCPDAVEMVRVEHAL